MIFKTIKTEITLLCLLLVLPSYGKSPPSLNANDLDFHKDQLEYSFIAAGHIYGSHNKSVYPSASIVSNVNLINSLNAEFMVLLGDIVRYPNENQIGLLKKSFLNKLSLPVFNSPGNHDVVDRSTYSKHFGSSFFSFQYQTELFVFLDSEVDNGRIMGSQLEFLNNNIGMLKGNSDIRSLFIFSHRLLWAIGNPPYDQVIPLTNGPHYHPQSANTISDSIIPILKSLKNKKVYFLSGDIGSLGSLPLFIEKDLESNITYIATGIGDTEDDMILKVNIKAGNVTFTPICLTGKDPPSANSYNLDFWANHPKNNKPKKRKGVLGKASKLLTHKYFWEGFGVSLLITTLLSALRKKRAGR